MSTPILCFPTLLQPTLTRVVNAPLEKAFISLLQEQSLVGKLELYCIYQKENKQSYALIYADYPQTVHVTLGTVSHYAKQDALRIQRALQMRHLPIDYIFLMPYFEATEGASILVQPIETKKEE